MTVDAVFVILHFSQTRQLLSFWLLTRDRMNHVVITECAWRKSTGVRHTSFDLRHFDCFNVIIVL